ncbi:unnamed protein product [Closterium sp. NIES-53]
MAAANLSTRNQSYYSTSPRTNTGTVTTPNSTPSGAVSNSCSSSYGNSYGSSYRGDQRSDYNGSPPDYRQQQQQQQQNQQVWQQSSLKPYPLMRVLEASMMEYANRSPSRQSSSSSSRPPRLNRGLGSGGSSGGASSRGSFATWSQGSNGSASSPYSTNSSTTRSPCGGSTTPVLDELSPGLGSGRLLSLETPRHRIGRRLQKHLSDRMFRESFWSPAPPRDSLPKPFTFKKPEGNGAAANISLVLVAILATVGIAIGLAMVSMPFLGLIESYFTGEPASLPALFPHPYSPFAYSGGGGEESMMVTGSFESGLNWGCADGENCHLSKVLLAAALGLSALLVLLMCFAFFVDKVLSRMLGHTIQAPTQHQLKRRPSENHIGIDWKFRLYGMRQICRMWKGGRVELLAGSPADYEVRHRGMTFSL